MSPVEDQQDKRLSLVTKTALLPFLQCADIAASAYGRDFLTSRQDGLQLVDVFCTSLTEIPEKHKGYVVNMCYYRELPKLMGMLLASPVRYVSERLMIQQLFSLSLQFSQAQKVCNALQQVL